MLCPQCGGAMNVISFFTDFSLTFVAERPPPPQAASQELLMAADVSAEYFL
ncbi:MAG TPA: acid--CoA ligase [Acidobacteriota bacterium]